MAFLPQIAFVLMAGTAFFLFGRKANNIYRNIRLGKDEKLDDRKSERLRNMLLIAFGQKKMFKNMIPALLHGVIYISFLIINIEILEIFVDGITGAHRAFAQIEWFQPIYAFTISFIEVLALGAIVASVSLLLRRNILNVARFRKPEMKGWPALDGNLILVFEIALMLFILTMSGSDYVLQSRGHEKYAVSADGPLNFIVSANLLSPLLSGLGDSSLILLERIGWWGHIAGIFFFLNYIPYSKHLHIMLAFPNTWFKRLDPAGKLESMPEITREVKLMMNPDTAFAAPAEGEAGPPERFGARDVTDLSWKNLLDAYSCTECGRCTAACPANQTGKKLSPRKIMMDTRDRLEEVGANIRANGGVFKDDGKALLSDEYISTEELRACNTCNACVEECPVTINPLDIILQMRRHQILDMSDSPEEWNGMFNNIENNGAPWAFSPQDRFKWADSLKAENS